MPDVVVTGSAAAPDPEPSPDAPMTAEATAPKAADAAAATVDTAADAAPTPAEAEAPPAADDEATRERVAALAARLRFFFSDANLRGDRWMCRELDRHGCLTLESLLKFKTIKDISTDRALLARAAADEAAARGLIAFDGERGEVRRVVTFDPKTMGDGSHLSLYVKNVPLTTPPPAEDATEAATAKEAGDAQENGGSEPEPKDENGSGEAKVVSAKEGEKKEGAETKKEGKKAPFRPRYAVTRDEVKALFEPYGPIGIIHLLHGPKPGQGAKGGSPHHRGGRGARHHNHHPLGRAIVEFENEESLAKACADLIAPDGGQAGSKPKGDGGSPDEEKKQEQGEEAGGKSGEVKEEEGEEAPKQTKGPATVLELKGQTLIVERMRPNARHHHQNNPSGSGNKKGNKKRPRDDDGDGDDDDGSPPQDDIQFEPVVYQWEKGCVLGLAGLSTTACDREAIREAVSEVLGVSNDVRTSGLYVDYNRGDAAGHLRLKEPRPDALRELAAKLNDGTVTIAGEKAEGCALLEGEAEEKYWEGFSTFLNNRKRMRLEEKRQRQRGRFGGRGGGRGGRGGRGRR